jgi:o-succinylbenzoate synthase
MFSYQSYQKNLIHPLDIGGQKLDLRRVVHIKYEDEIISELSPLPGLHSETLAESLPWVENFFSDIINTHDLEKIFNKRLDNNPDLTTLIKQHSSQLFFNLFPSLQIRYEEAPSSAIFAIELAIINLLNKEEFSKKQTCYLDFDKSINFSNGIIKIKIGRNNILDEKQKLRNYIENTNLIIRLDGNRKMQAKDLAFLLESLPIDRFQYIEDPFINASEMSKFYEHYDIDIALAWDENFKQLISHDNILSPKYLRFAIIKPNLQGGISRAVKYAQKLKKLQIDTVISSSFETEIGIAGLNKIHYLFPDIFTEVPGLDTMRYFK